MAYIDYSNKKDAFLKEHGDFVINKYLELYEYKTFCVYSLMVGMISTEAFNLMIATIDYLGYDFYKVDFGKLTYEEKCKYRSNIYFKVPTYIPTFSYDLDTGVKTIIEKPLYEIAKKVEGMPSQFDIDSFVLRRRSDNEFVALTDEIYPLEIENEIFLVRGIVDYLHTNKGIKCQSSVSASKKFVAAFLDVEIDPEFKKYVHYASHLPVVENTYPHVINRWGSDKYSRPKRYVPNDLLRARIKSGEEIDGLKLDDYSEHDKIIKNSILIVVIIILLIVYFSK